MQNTNPNYYHLLCGQLLKRVSRSFYLTLQVLPKSVREPICLGYLLARCTDTIADSSTLAANQRLQNLTNILHLINKQNTPAQTSDFQNRISASNYQHNEQDLLNHFNQLIEWLFTMDPFSQNEITRLLNKIIHGQQLDIERFNQTNNLVGIKTINELEDYTYLVAGCVGEFWTNICEHYLPNYSTKTALQLQPLAIAFGKGLQIINILRDIPEDFRSNRCYLPAEQLQHYDVRSDQLLTQSKQLQPVLHFWHDKAALSLNDGWHYLLSIKNKRIRYALLIPLLVAYKTLRLLQDQNYLIEPQAIKVSRTQVKFIMIIAMIGAWSNKFAGYLHKLIHLPKKDFLHE